MRKVLIVSAHPDDETFGAGGTLLRHKANGDEIFWLIVTNIFEDQGFSEERVKQRRDEIANVAHLFDFDGIYKLDYPTTSLSSTSLIKMIPEISKIFQEVKPEIVYTLNRSDVHSDHRIVFDAVMACTKSFRSPFVKQLLMYECVSETEFAPALAERVFIPNYFVDITHYLHKKLEIIRVFESELGEHPFPRSIENVKSIAHFRGASAGVQYAEAFQVLKFIDK